MDQKVRIVSLLILLLTAGCHDREAMKGLDQSQWKTDKMGCTSWRMKMTSILSQEKNSLLGFGQREVLQILGNPDRRELSSQSQQFFIYFLEKGEQCGQDSDKVRVSTLEVRFNALKQVSEVSVRIY